MGLMGSSLSACACGCGGNPKGKNSRYCTGHNPRSHLRGFPHGSANPVHKLNLKKPGTASQRKWAKTKADPVAHESQKVGRRRRTAAYRKRVIDHYGGVCACCGEDKLEFLCMDHVNGGGNEHRRELKTRGGNAIYRWLVKNNCPDDFRVLCHNCNFALGAYGYCPHQTHVHTHPHATAHTKANELVRKEDRV